MGGYHSNYTIFFLLAFSWLSLPLRAATSSNWERDTPLPKGPRTWLGLTSIAVGLIYRTHWCLRWMLSSCAFQREYAVRCQRPSKSLTSLGKCVSGRLSSDCVRSLCCCYLDLLQLYAVCQLYTSTSKRPHEAMGPLGSDQKLSGNGVGQIFFTWPPGS